jgi:hypothetical protein
MRYAQPVITNPRPTRRLHSPPYLAGNAPVCRPSRSIAPFAVLLLLVCCLAVESCHSGPRTFESTALTTRVVPVHRDASGRVQTMDVEFDWVGCPGRQHQLVRAGADFAACAASLKPGETVPVTVLWEWDEHGHYDWHVLELKGCKLAHVDDDDSSYEMVTACESVRSHDAVVGFHCDRSSDGDLIRKCPWFRR